MIIGKIDEADVTSEDITINSSFTVNHYSDQLRLALLTVVTGYLEKDNIELPTRAGESINKKKLGDFLSYMLNDRRAAPRNYAINLTFASKHQPSYRSIQGYAPSRVISLSGGIDSVAGLLVALENNENIMPVWVGFGQKNEETELVVAEAICDKLGLELQKVHVNINKYMDHEWKHWKSGIIPGRNFLFASIASQLLGRSGGTISICAHKEEITDTNTDKSVRFFEESSKFLTQFAGFPIEVSTPFMNVTKPELIAYWHSHWTEKFGVSPEDTVSCYFGNNCGECKACFNRALSFVAANVPLESYSVNPLTNEKLLVDDYISRFDELVEDRRADMLYAMMRYRDAFSDPVKDFIDSQSHKYDPIIKSRQEKILSGDSVREAIHDKR